MTADSVRDMVTLAIYVSAIFPLLTAALILTRRTWAQLARTEHKLAATWAKLDRPELAAESSARAAKFDRRAVWPRRATHVQPSLPNARGGLDDIPD